MCPGVEALQTCVLPLREFGPNPSAISMYPMVQRSANPFAVLLHAPQLFLSFRLFGKDASLALWFNRFASYAMRGPDAAVHSVVEIASWFRRFVARVVSKRRA